MDINIDVENCQESIPHVFRAIGALWQLLRAIKFKSVDPSASVQISAKRCNELALGSDLQLSNQPYVHELSRFGDLGDLREGGF